MNKTLTCIECPIGCEITVKSTELGLTVSGNKCKRGELYAKNEVICPRRVLTSTVKTIFNKFLPVKTDKPIKKEDIFKVMKLINEITVDFKAKIGDTIIENIIEDINLIATGNL